MFYGLIHVVAGIYTAPFNLCCLRNHGPSIDTQSRTRNVVTRTTPYLCCWLNGSSSHSLALIIYFSPFFFARVRTIVVSCIFITFITSNSFLSFPSPHSLDIMEYVLKCVQMYDLYSVNVIAVFITFSSSLYIFLSLASSIKWIYSYQNLFLCYSEMKFSFIF